MTTKQVILVAVLAATVHVLCGLLEAAPAQAWDPTSERVVRALERIANNTERCAR